MIDHNTSAVVLGPVNTRGKIKIPISSGNGRYVAFSSAATNLVNNDTNFTLDVFQRRVVER